MKWQLVVLATCFGTLKRLADGMASWEEDEKALEAKIFATSFA